ncbi:MNIO family bufferin maturase [Crenobacter caeni]|uniref:DUF692 domain-containing protein n=1 Tax=Crenobacter caeni TaxID=2705474 RepID=A0A6B2KT38_9NEIS|nr:DUF692 domain-containing protein [Crenobacter caeni]NDV13159.1 DUF692 domain-containing protein [Crenobacter caeni]
MRLGAGLGIKPQHFCDALAARDAGLWYEVHPENYLADGGPRRAWLRRLREEHPLSLHGVSLSLAGPDTPDAAHLQALAALTRELEPALVSEHLAWSRLNGVYLPDLLPVPRTRATLERLCANIGRVQDALGRAIAIEHPAHYLVLPHEMDEAEFLHEMVRASGCRLLIDVNNVYVGARNLGYDAAAWLDAIDGDAVAEVHLAGHSADPLLGERLLVDSHDCAVAEPVWALYTRLIARIGARPTLIERDGEVPELAGLLAERTRAQAVLDETEACA